MNLRKDKLGLIIGAAVIAVVAIVLAAVLIKVWQGYSTVKSDLDGKKARLTQLQRRDPYPSRENVERIAENANLMEQRFEALMGDLLQGQIEPKPMERAEFPPLLERSVRRLRSAAEEAKVTLPAGFSMGFDRYLKGELPQNTNEISRLIVQLQEAEKVLGLVFSVGLGEIVSFNRELFEGTASATAEIDASDPRAARRARRAARTEDAAEASGPVALKKQSELYSSEHFVLEVRGREEAIWRFLNEMARNDMKIVVTSIQLSSDQPDIKRAVEAIKQASKTAADLAARGAMSGQSQRTGMFQQGRVPTLAGTAAPAIVPSAEERVVAGREPVTAKIEFDIYRFKTQTSTQETAE